MMRRLEAPERASGLDELLLAQRQHLAAHDARDVGPVDDRDDHDHHRQARLDQAAEAPVGAGARRGEAEAEQQDREREHDVDETREHGIGDAAVETGHEADRCADRRRRCRWRSVRPRARRARHRWCARTRRGRAGRRRRDARRTGRWACRRGRAPPSSARAGRACRRSRRSPGAKTATTISTTMKHSAVERDLVPAQPAPEQLQRRARGDLLRRRAALLDDLGLVLGLVHEADGIAGAQESALALRAALMMMSSSCSPAVPGRALRTFLMHLPCGASDFPGTPSRAVCRYVLRLAGLRFLPRPR